MTLDWDQYYQLPLTPTEFRNDLWWVAPLNFHPAVLPASARARAPYIHDVTLRDGEQTPGVAFKADERIAIAEALSEIGVHRIEAGMPIAGPEVAEAIRTLCGLNLKATIVPSARAEIDDLKLTLDTGARAVIIVHTINPYHCRYAFNLTPPQLIDRVVTAVEFARGQGLDVTFQASDVFRCDLDYIKAVLGAIVERAKPHRLTLTDTYGIATPDAVRYLFSQAKTWWPTTKLEFHGHNDYALGAGASLAAFLGGADGLHASFNGLGERSGNAATEALVAGFKMLLNIDLGIALTDLTRVGEMIATIARVSIPQNAPITGGKLFETESSIIMTITDKLEQVGVMASMIPYRPEATAREPLTFTLGKWAGRIAVERKLAELGIAATPAETDAIWAAVKQRGRLLKAGVSDREFRHIVTTLRKA